MPSPSRLLALGLLVTAALPSVRSTDCTLSLTATSDTQWRVGCADDISQQQSATTATVTFDPKQLTVVKIGSFASVELKPLNSPQPTELHLPARRIKIDGLVSSSLAALSIEGDATATTTATLEISASSFVGLTAVKTLSLSSVNVTGTSSLKLPSTIREISITRSSLTELKLSAVSGSSSLNITKVDLRFNRLRRIPLVVLASRTLLEANLQDNAFPALRLSRRKVRRIVRLVATKRLLLGTIADFSEQCDGGEKTSVRIGKATVVVCQVPSEDDDNEVAEEAGDSSDSSGSIAASSSELSNSSETTTTTGGSTTNSSKTTTTIVTNSTTTIVTTSTPSNSTKTSTSAMNAVSKLSVLLAAVASLLALNL